MGRPFFVMRKLLLSLLTVLSVLPLGGRTLPVGNGDFSSSIVFRGHRITGVTFTDLHSGRELTASSQEPLFEFCIDGQVITSSDPVWSYAGRSQRTLANGGIVTRFCFRGRGAWKGLQLVWDREVFPDGTFVRERLRLGSGSGRVFHLSDVDGANRLIFPRYSFASEGPVRAKELRIGTFRKKRAFPEHHMFHPDSTLFDVAAVPCEVKGPFLVLSGSDYKIVTSYEHASQDNADAMSVEKTGLSVQTANGNDGSQGVAGDVQALTDDDLWFISSFVSQTDGRLVLGNRIRHGGYLDGETIPSGGVPEVDGLRSGWYETVWSTLCVLPPDGDEGAAIADYLLTRITENAISREADFYYNSWGMQRASSDLYTVMNEGRLREEMRLAAACGARTFVIDDGWHETFGHWVCNPERIPSGLHALCAYMDSLGLRPGIWLSLPGAAATSERYRAHPEWIVRDARGEPVLAQWKQPVYDIVGPYYDALLSDMKALTDEGFRFFKWDAMNTLSSTLAGLDHGDASYSERARADRYNYLLPFYVTSLMRELREYCPGVVIEIDLTEPERCLVGLQVLQEGKYYFINNGASKYNDYSGYRTRSVRTVIHDYAFLMPQELFTYAVYPHDAAGSMVYNATTALTAGHGIWGDLTRMTDAQRAVVKGLFDKASMVLPFIRGSRVEVSGPVGGTPEIYVQRQPSTGWALLTAFGSGVSDAGSSGVPDADSSAGTTTQSYPFTIAVRPSEVLGVLGHPFRLGPDGVELTLSFEKSDDCASVFVLGGKGSGPQVYASTGCLDSIEVTGAGSSTKGAQATDLQTHDTASPAQGLLVRAATDAEVTVAMPDGRLVTHFLPAGTSFRFE